MSSDRSHDAPEPTQETSVDELLKELIDELNALANRLQALSPGQRAPSYSPQRLLALINEKLGECSPELRLDIMDWLQVALGSDLFDPATWKGLWFLLTYSVNLQADVIKRRFTGEYETDEWGLDWELWESVIPFLTFLYETYWRTETTGVEYIPALGGTLLVSNHSGQLPWDAAMIGTALWNEHPSQRLVRSLYSPWFASVPFISAMFMKLGHAVSTVENGSRLLKQAELVAVFPEGHDGMGKLYKERYQLTRFGRGGFVKMALSSGAPIIPVSVVGAEETYVSLAKSETVARVMGVPFRGWARWGWCRCLPNGTSILASLYPPINSDLTLPQTYC
jgi:1-acyl-sn-glycerol-3-phosphate acyltransferase